MTKIELSEIFLSFQIKDWEAETKITNNAPTNDTHYFSLFDKHTLFQTKTHLIRVVVYKQLISLFVVFCSFRVSFCVCDHFFSSLPPRERQSSSIVRATQDISLYIFARVFSAKKIISSLSLSIASPSEKALEEPFPLTETLLLHCSEIRVKLMHPILVKAISTVYQTRRRNRLPFSVDVRGDSSVAVGIYHTLTGGERKG